MSIQENDPEAFPKGLPVEVYSEVLLFFSERPYVQGTLPGIKDVNPEHVRAFDKGPWTRGAAWAQVPLPPSPERNPWRKCHSRNYWIWFHIEEYHRICKEAGFRGWD